MPANLIHCKIIKPVFWRLDEYTAAHLAKPYLVEFPTID